MVLIESFEVGDLSNYTGETGDFTVETTQSHDGSYSLTSSSSAFRSITSDGSHTPIEEGDTFRWWTYQAINGASMQMWCVQDSASSNSYWSDYSERDSRIRLGYWDGGSATYNSATVSTNHANEWVYIEVTHGAGGELTATLYDATDAQLATVSFSDGRASPYTTGTIGWGRYGDTNNPSYIDNLTTETAGETITLSGSATASGTAVATPLRGRESSGSVSAEGAISAPLTSNIGAVSGTFIYNGSAVSGATVRGINDTQGTHQGTDTTDENGDYAIDFSPGDEGHFMVEYEDPETGEPVKAESKPFINTQ